jgi:hypothetical protein
MLPKDTAMSTGSLGIRGLHTGAKTVSSSSVWMGLERAHYHMELVWSIHLLRGLLFDLS